MKLGKEAAMEITKCFKAPIKLEFEKVIFIFFQINAFIISQINTLIRLDKLNPLFQ
jgi:hypothetical protein